MPRAALAALGLLGASACLTAQPGEARLTLEGGHAFVAARIDGQGPFKLMLDTGAGSNILTRPVAQRLRVNLGGLRPTQGLGGEGPARRGRLRELRVGTASVPDVPVYVRNFARGTSFDGLLGWPFLEEFRVVIDYPRGRVSFERSARSGSPLLLTHRMPKAQVRIDGQGPFVFGLDTGAPTSLISEALARRLQLAPGAPTRLVGIAGTEPSHRVIVDRLAVGPEETRDFALFTAADLDVATEGVEGLLGQDFLSTFRVTLDYRAGTVDLERLTTPAAVSAAPPSGQAASH